MLAPRALLLSLLSIYSVSLCLCGSFFGPRPRGKMCIMFRSSLRFAPGQRQGLRLPTPIANEPQRHRGAEEGKVTNTFQQLRPDFPINPDASAKSFAAQLIEYLLCVSVPLWFIFWSASAWQDVYNVQVVASVCPRTATGIASSHPN